LDINSRISFGIPKRFKKLWLISPILVCGTMASLEGFSSSVTSVASSGDIRLRLPSVFDIGVRIIEVAFKVHHCVNSCEIARNIEMSMLLGTFRLLTTVNQLDLFKSFSRIRGSRSSDAGIGIPQAGAI
jgi:hypothetical protein